MTKIVTMAQNKAITSQTNKIRQKTTLVKMPKVFLVSNLYNLIIPKIANI